MEFESYKYKGSTLFYFQKGTNHPFDTEIELHNVDQNFNGPGIYFIEYNKSVIYIGKYQPARRGDIRTDRWKRHFMSFYTCGSNLGFGSPKKIEKLKSSYQTNRNYLNVIEQYRKMDNLKDTGITTSINRMLFSSDNWESFATYQKAVKSLDDFEIHFYRMITEHTNSSGIISLIEQYLLTKHHPICNAGNNFNENTDIKAETIIASKNEIIEFIKTKL